MTTRRIWWIDWSLSWDGGYPQIKRAKSHPNPEHEHTTFMTFAEAKEEILIKLKDDLEDIQRQIHFFDSLQQKDIL